MIRDEKVTSQSLQDRITELERQLGESRVTILALKSLSGTGMTSRFDLLFSYSRDIILFMERDGGQILEANNAAVREYGYSREELLSIRIQDLRAPDTLKLTDEQMARADAEGLLFETAHKRKDGSVFPVEVSSQGAFAIDGKRTLISMVRNISERKQADEERERLIRQIEQERNEAHSRVEELNAILEAMHDPVLVYGKDGYIYRCNSSAVKAHGFDPSQQHRDQAVKNMVVRHPDGSMLEIKDLPSAKALQGSPVIEENLEVTNQERRSMNLQVTATPLIVNGEQTGAVSVWHDITDLKRSEKALQAALAEAEAGRLMLEVILEHIPTGLMITGGPPDFLISRISCFAAEMTLRPEQELVGIPVGQHREAWKMFMPDGITQPPFEQLPLYRAARLGEQIHNFELVIEAQDGRKIPVLINASPVRNAHGQIVSAISSWVDITHIKQAEEALRASEARFRQLADAMPQLVWTAAPDGKVDYYNQRRTRYTGITGLSDGSWDWAPVLHPDDVEATVTAWQHSLKSGVTYQIEHRVKMSDGTYRWHLSRAVCVRDEERITTRWYGTATDIHDVKLAEAALQKYTGQLEHSNAELQEFAFVASHDLQEPLRKIEAFGDLLLEDAGNLTERQADLLNRVRSSAGRMRSMVVGLLHLSRLATEAQPFERIDLNQLIREVLIDLERQLHSSGGSVEVEQLPGIEGDPLQIRQLFQNLIGNALKFQPNGGKPLVRISTRQPDPTSVKIIIEDNGIGFDSAHAEQLFQPFKRFVGRRDYEGSGMGLAISRKIVERHGGSISVISRLGEGATFTITLPTRQTHHKVLQENF